MMPHRPNAMPQAAFKTRVLIAEDDEVNRSVFSDFLALSGYDVIAAANGMEAIEQCRNEHPDVVLMDVNMPGMNGLEAIAHIRQLPERADVPIIALTAMAMSSDRQACLDAGANEYLSKPAPLRTIRSLIESLVASYQRPEAGESQP